METNYFDISYIWQRYAFQPINSIEPSEKEKLIIQINIKYMKLVFFAYPFGFTPSYNVLSSRLKS